MRIVVSLFLLLAVLSLGAYTLVESPAEPHCAATQLPALVSKYAPKGAPAPLPTKIWIWREGDTLHFDFEAVIDHTFNPGSPSTPDSGVSSDRVSVRLCPGSNEKIMYYFNFYPQENIQDGVLWSMSSGATDWNSDYHYESHYSGNLWVVRAEIPLSSMRMPGEPPYNWSIQVERLFNDLGYNERYTWPQVDTDHSFEAFVDTMESFIINSEIAKPRPYKAIAYFSRTYDMVDESQTYDPDHVGLTVEYRPTRTITCKAAFNPDFSETPPDNETDTSNLKYAQYLSENRYFFIEDIDVFGVDSGYLYTRAIAQPQYAVKASGTGKHLTWGVLNALDKKVGSGDNIENHDDMYTVVGLRPTWSNFDVQLDLMSRRNPDDDREAITAYVSPHWTPGDIHDIVGAFFVTDDIRPVASEVEGETESNRRRGSYGKVSHMIDLGDLALQYWGKFVTEEFAPAIASPGSDEENGYYCYGGYIGWDHTYVASLVREASFGLDFSELDYFDDDEKPRYSAYLSSDITLQKDWTFSSGANMYDTVNEGVRHDCYSFSANVVYTRFNWLCLSLNGQYAKQIVWNVNQTCHKSYVQFSVSGIVASRLDYGVYTCRTTWYDFPSSYKADACYDICNVNLTYAIAKNLFISSGLRFNNYEASGYADSGELLYKLENHIGAFATMQYLYKNRWRFYLGYNGVDEEWEDHYEVMSKTGWFKVNLTY